MKDEYNEASAAAYLGLSPRTLRRYRMAGLIGYHRSPGGRISYTLDQMIDFQLSTRVAPSQASAA
ncbi:DNA-binding transcriptional MerR regulator [Sphingobium sp. OAS761]|nr:DNA-binding transcriptional MerR regulator [Sphingobium sp. OAS761]